MCGRIGMVTGKGISGVIRKHYSKPILYFAVSLLFVTNTINIGADLGAMASSAQLLINLPFVLWLIPMAIFTLFLEVFISYKVYAKFLKYLTFSLFAYVIVAFALKLDWLQVLSSTVVPTISLNKAYLFNIIAILGTTISPYLFFWQTGEEVEEEVESHKLKTMGEGTPKINRGDIRKMRADTVVGMFFSNLIMFFIITTAAATLFANNIHNVDTAQEAALALQPIAGNFTFILFAAGIIGTGLLAVPVLAGSASYAISEALGWREGLYRKFTKAHGFYAVIAAATLVGILVNFSGVPPFKMLYYTAVLNGLIAPPLMILILLISSNPEIMGTYTNSKFSNYMGITITAIMSIASLLLLGSVFF